MATNIFKLDIMLIQDEVGMNPTDLLLGPRELFNIVKKTVLSIFIELGAF